MPHGAGRVDGLGRDVRLREGEPITAANGLGITCAVCHDPHDATNTAQLRYPLATTDPSQNSCA